MPKLQEKRRLTFSIEKKLDTTCILPVHFTSCTRGTFNIVHIWLTKKEEYLCNGVSELTITKRV
jgi:hypothetical protein